MLTCTRRRESVKVGAAAGHVLMLAGLLGQWPRSSYAHDVGRGSLSNLVGSSSKGAPVVAAMLYRGFCCLSPAAGPAASYMPAPLALLPLSAAGRSEASAVGVFGGGFFGVLGVVFGWWLFPVFTGCYLQNVAEMLLMGWFWGVKNPVYSWFD